MQRTPLTQEEMTEYGYLKANKDKFDIEVSRFKNDCRKRALDLAAEQKRQEDRNYSTATEFTAQQGEPSKIDVLSIADKYYEWLTKELN